MRGVELPIDDRENTGVSCEAGAEIYTGHVVVEMTGQRDLITAAVKIRLTPDQADEFAAQLVESAALARAHRTADV